MESLKIGGDLIEKMGNYFCVVFELQYLCRTFSVEENLGPSMCGKIIRY